MSNYNNSLLFYKKYYDGVDWSKKSDDKDNSTHFAERNIELTKSILPEREEELPFGYNIPKEHCIDLETTYPGLLLGSGITHGSGLLGEIKLGFFLDHTTGLPVIPGSSVKGVLRSVFPLGFKYAAKKEKKSDSEKKAYLQEKAQWVTEYIGSKLAEIAPEQKWEEKVIEAFETWLFGSYETGVKVGPMSGRTIFHDALPLSAARVKINGIYTNQYLSTDFITPHKNRKNNGIPDALVNPTPIGFLKVLPGVVFRFQFHFEPYNKDGQEVLSTENIRDLFKSILLDIGVGAKTNVGYGQFIDPRPKPPPNQRRTANQSLGHSLPGTEQKQARESGKRTPPPFTRYPRVGETVELYGIIKQPNKENQPNRITFITEPENIIQGYKHEKLNAFKPGDTIKIKIRLHAQKSNEVAEILNVELFSI